MQSIYTHAYNILAINSMLFSNDSSVVIASISPKISQNSRKFDGIRENGSLSNYFTDRSDTKRINNTQQHTLYRLRRNGSYRRSGFNLINQSLINSFEIGIIADMMEAAAFAMKFIQIIANRPHSQWIRRNKITHTDHLSITKFYNSMTTAAHANHCLSILLPSKHRLTSNKFIHVTLQSKIMTIMRLPIYTLMVSAKFRDIKFSHFCTILLFK